MLGLHQRLYRVLQWSIGVLIGMDHRIPGFNRASGLQKAPFLRRLGSAVLDRGACMTRIALHGRLGKRNKDLKGAFRVT